MPDAHRDTDSRSCGAKTTVNNQSSVYVNGKLWAVKDSTNDHNNGQLIPTGQSVYVEGKLVIVHTPDNAQQDDLCPPLNGEHCNPKTAQGSNDVSAY
jgi:hypothetical protein